MLESIFTLGRSGEADLNADIPSKNGRTSQISPRQGKSEDAFVTAGIHRRPEPLLDPGREQVAICGDFRWDGCDAYLFDIDGTLMHAQGGVHMDSFSSSVFDVLGRQLSLDHVLIHGNIDTGILREAFARSEIADELWRPKLPEILDRMCATVDARREQMKIVLNPGVIETLAYLKTQGKALGVATGNLERIGWLKIELAGLRDYFSFGGFSDRHWARAEMIASAAERARQIAGVHASVCVVGDTPSDIAAARANSLPVIAVATGTFSFAALEREKPDATTSTLAALLRTAAPER